MEDYVIKIGSNGRISKYIERCNRKLKTSDRIRLKGVKKAIPKTISIAEILKRKNIELSLAQTTEIKYVTITDDADDSQEDGFIGAKKTKKVSMIEITLVKTPQTSDKSKDEEKIPVRDETLIKKRDPNVEYKIL